MIKSVLELFPGVPDIEMLSAEEVEHLNAAVQKKYGSAGAFIGPQPGVRIIEPPNTSPSEEVGDLFEAHEFHEMNIDAREALEKRLVQSEEDGTLRIALIQVTDGIDVKRQMRKALDKDSDLIVMGVAEGNAQYEKAVEGAKLAAETGHAVVVLSV